RRDEFLSRDRDLAAVEELLKPVAREPERRVADANGVALRQRLRGDTPAVDEDAVLAAQVDDLVPAPGAVAHLGVVTRDQEVIQHQVVVRCAADPQVPREDRHDGAGAFCGTRYVLRQRNYLPLQWRRGHRDVGSYRGGRAGLIGKHASKAYWPRARRGI